MKLFDCFLYNGEERMLVFRLHELNDVADKFIIVEANTGFSGNKKPLRFNIDKLHKFKDKIIYKPYTITPSNNAWENEANQRRHLINGLFEAAPEKADLVMLSDVDKIPDTDILANIKSTGLHGALAFYHNFYYYNYRCRNINKWAGTVLTSIDGLNGLFNNDFEIVRNSRWGVHKIGSPGDYNSGGWHFSYFGDENYIIDKIKNFSHQEYNNPTYTDPEKIKNLIKEGKDLFFREEQKYEFLDNQTYLPKNINLLD
jgi:beta-1,4-mannosyl-glycoprotein beta-1,4-N-acetylglucosaminyltransferase